jgi:hypothetical protein
MMNLNTSKAFFNYFDIRFRRKIDIYLLIIGLIWMSYATIK